MRPPPETNDDTGWMDLITAHIQRYPAMTARDVYKLLYQGILGPEHSMPSEEIFTRRLQAELAELQPDASQPLLENIRPDGALRRIYLRPWLASGKDLNELAAACLETGRRRWGAPTELRKTWDWFLGRVEQDSFPSISHDDARAFDALLREHDYPAAHHSEGYVSHYKPAYRLIGSAFDLG